MMKPDATSESKSKSQKFSRGKNPYSMPSSYQRKYFTIEKSSQQEEEQALLVKLEYIRAQTP